MKGTGRLLLGFLLLIGASAPARAQRRPTRAEAEEAPLSYSFAGIDTIVTVLFAGGTPYVPAGTLFRLLQIEARLEPGSRLSGFYLTPDTTFFVDGEHDLVQVGKRTITLSPTDAILDAFDVYLRPAVFERAFGFRVLVDMRELTLRIYSPVPLPALEAALRAQRRTQAGPASFMRPPGPLLFPLTRPLLDGLTAAYSLGVTAVVGGTAPNASGGSIGIGGRLAGGDLVASGTVSGQGKTLDWTGTDLRWRYGFADARRRITQLELGTLPQGEGIRLLDMRGIEASNQPLELRSRLGQQDISGYAGQGWEVELYADRELVAYTRAAPDGTYRFSVPVRRGSALVTLKFYGPNGEVRTEERRLQAPLVFVPAGQVDYTLALGRTTEGRLAARSAIGFGISSPLAGEVEAEYLDAAQQPRTILSGRLSYRLPWTGAFALQAATNAFYRFDAQTRLPSQASLSLQATRYLNADPLINPLGARRALRLDGNTSARLPLRVDLRGSGTIWQAWTGGTAADLDVGANVDLAAVRGFLDARAYGAGTGADLAAPRRLTAGFIYATLGVPRWLSSLNQSLITASTDWTTRPLVLTESRLSLARSVRRAGRVSLGVAYRRETRGPLLDLRFDVNAATVLASTLAHVERGSASLSQSMRGGISSDETARTVRFDGRSWLGAAAAAFLPFVDFNGDGIRQADEPIIRNVGIRFRESVGTTLGSDSLLRVVGLIAYVRYSVDVDASQVQNPLWVPRASSFSFVAEPNVYRPIYVPFYVGAVMEGTVLREAGGPRQPLPGLRLHVTGVSGGYSSSVETFSDGSIYLVGLPPGDYDVVPDATQLSLLGARAEPAARRLTVHPSHDGENVTGVDFLIRPATAPEVVAPGPQK